MRKWIVTAFVLALLTPASAQAKPDLPTMTLPDLKFLVGKALKRERQLDYHESSGEVGKCRIKGDQATGRCQVGFSTRRYGYYGHVIVGYHRSGDDVYAFYIMNFKRYNLKCLTNGNPPRRCMRRITLTS